MAIKGKGRSKGRPVAKAPRRMPVKAPVPVAQRRWVQVTVAALLGAVVIALIVWVGNGIRESNAEEDAARVAQEDQRQAAEQRTLAADWKSTVESAFGSIATVAPDRPPVVEAEVSTVLDALVKGDDPGKGAADTLDSASKALDKAIKDLRTSDLMQQIAGKDFELATTEYLIRSREDLLIGLKGVATAVDLAKMALAAEGSQREALAGSAKAVFDDARTLIDDAWRAYENALAAVGISQAQQPPPSSIPGLTP
jgi:hypothetical protein